MRGLVAPAIALALLAQPALAVVADEESPEKAQARMLLSQGNQLFERGDLRGALANFHAAYALYPSPKLLVNAAAAERELGDLPGAATDLRHFLDDATDDEGALVDKARADLRAIERKVGRIGIKAWPQRTTLEIDGRAARDPTYVRPGAHAIKVRAAAGLQLDRDVDVAAGESVELPVPEGAHLTAAEPRDGERRPVVNKRRTWLVPVVVLGALVVAGGVTAGVLLGTQSSGKPLTGDLGTIGFSQFH